MTAKRPLISIVCPAYNEELVLPLFHRALIDVLAGLQDDYRFEIIYVDDGSRDGTRGVLQSMSAQDPNVHWYAFSRNFGHQAALSAGMERATGDAVITMDSDLQHPPELIESLLVKWREGFDVVVTVRQDDPNLNFFKRLTSNGFYRILRMLGGAKIPIGAADFRLLSRKALNALITMREVHRFLRGMVHWIGFSTAEIHYMPGRRGAGASHYSLRKMVRLAGDGIFSTSVTPLRLLAGTGVATLGLAAMTGVALVLAALCNFDAGPTLLQLTLVSVLAMGGSILVGLGLVGEYVGRTFEQVKERPAYLVAASSDDDSDAASRLKTAA